MILVPAETIDDYVRRGWWGETTIGELFIDTALRRGDAFAVADPPDLESISGEAPRRWSWAELLRETGRVCAWLNDCGLRKDDVIVVQLPNGVDLHAIYLACAISGVVISPVPVQYRAHELAHVVETTGARLAITCDRVGRHPAAQHWAEHRGGLRSIEQLWAFGDAKTPPVQGLRRTLDQTTPWGASEMRARMRDIGLSAHDVLTICWTSGTEARSKGVPRNHNEWMIVGHSVIDAAQLAPGSQMVIPFPFVNMAGVSTSLMGWLLLGGGLHHHHPFNLEVFVAQLRDQPCDYTVAAPALLAMLLKQPQLMDGVDLSRLRTIGSGGAPLADWLVEQFYERFGIELINYFGSNEGASLSSSPRDVPDRRQRARFFPRVGVSEHDWGAINSKKIQTRLIDLDTGLDITEPGRVGELRFKGPTIFSGYYRAPELTAAAFDQQGFYRTGDLFAIDGERGQFYRFVGRHKDIVIRGGINISAEEVEALLLGHPKVREAAVIGIPDPVMGERVCAVIAPQSGQTIGLDELVDHLRRVEEVAAFKWPERLEIVEALPRNPVGKVLKRELRARFAKD